MACHEMRRYIHRYLKRAFDGLRNPFSQLMTCNLNIGSGITDVAMNIVDSGPYRLTLPAEINSLPLHSLGRPLRF